MEMKSSAAVKSILNANEKGAFLILHRRKGLTWKARNVNSERERPRRRRAKQKTDEGESGNYSSSSDGESQVGEKGRQKRVVMRGFYWTWG